MEKLYGWQSEYDRLRRWSTRISAVESQSVEFDLQSLLDFYLSFFQSAYILQEWLKHQLPEKDQAVSKRAPHHGLIRDIAVRHRHLTMERPSYDSSFSICREYAPHCAAGWRFVLLSDGQQYRLDELVRETIEYWSQLVASGDIEDSPLIAAGSK
jgi:hypothetical protein